MSIFVSGLTDYFGASLVDVFAAAGDAAAPVVGGTIDAGAAVPAGATGAVVVRSDDAEGLERRLVAALAGVETVVVDLNGPLAEAVAVIKAVRRTRKGGSVTAVVCVSSVQTWARTPAGRRRDPAEEPPALSEDGFTARKPFAAFAQMKAAEAQALSLAGENLSVTVMAAGVLYGNGEGPLHSLFKAAWRCAPLGTPAFRGGGQNFVPTVHVRHLAHAVARAAAAAPAQPYVVVVDQAQSTLRDIVQAVGGALNGGAPVPVLSADESDRLVLDDPQMAALQVDLRFDLAGGGLEQLALGEGQAACADGLVANIDAVVAQFLARRDLRPVRVAVLAPPGAGAAGFAAQLAADYRLPLVDGPGAAAEFTAAFSAAAADDEADAAAEEEGGGAAADAEGKADGAEPTADQALAAELKEAAEAGAALSPGQLARVVRWKLRTPPCQNQGYVLVGVPASFSGAVDAFCAEADPGAAPDAAAAEGDDAAAAAASNVDHAIVPTSVLFLDAADEWLKARADGGGADGDEAGAADADGGAFAAELQAFRDAHDAEKGRTALSFFEVACKLETLSLSVDTAAREEVLDGIRNYVEKGGRPNNYHPTSEEAAALLRDQADSERGEAEARLSAERLEEKEAEGARAERAADNLRRLGEVERREAELLEARSLPLRNYLMAYVMPTLTQGLVDVCKVRPDDPVDYLAELLFKATE